MLLMLGREPPGYGVRQASPVLGPGGPPQDEPPEQVELPGPFGHGPVFAPTTAAAASRIMSRHSDRVAPRDLRGVAMHWDMGHPEEVMILSRGASVGEDHRGSPPG